MSDTLIPDNIELGKQNREYNKKVLIFGSFTMFLFGTKITMKIRRISGIDLIKESNEWDGQFFVEK